MKPDNEFVFDVDTIASYLYSKKPNISPLKLQKSLYFLFAYHGAVYAQDSEVGVFEGVANGPQYLFEARFEAWQYGPVIRDVYNKDKRGFYSDPDLMEQAIEKVSRQQEIKMFIDDLFEQIDSVSDFKLVDRSHQDVAWKNAHAKGQSTEMNNEEIILEYKESYV
ncbi:Panacea domain-containing protein [Paenibacillus woosongensis]|uniref:Antitoxin SocA-like Panacea domain-containing protein n=1 Tax=Paenibacillus woosongensis TaxID=307580 RepID=A0ABQ4MXD2_9BACL|nr:type II toxin-antitoxin system antitoxin SocA domain-containing protein [Paenibacillus woosongensis]GIP60597.1 hypothetical protein J15TS10_44110 [Paenibacillus woosongensis]